MDRTSVTADIRAISNVGSTTAAMSVNNSTAAMSDAVADGSFMDLDGSIHSHNDNIIEPETDDEEEERARRAFIDSLKQSALPPPPTSLDDAQASTDADDAAATSAYETKSEVESEKERREDDVKQLSLDNVAVDVGRIYNDEGSVMDEAERTLAALTAAPDARAESCRLQVH